MLLENTSVGVIAFGMSGPKPAKGQRSVTSIKPVIVIPGVNYIEPKAWEEIGKNPSTLAFIEDGRLIKHDGPTAAEKKKAAASQPQGTIVHDDFLGMEEAQVVRIVKKTLFLPLLERWIEGENRPKVIRAIHKQIDVAGPTEVKKD